MCKIYNLIGSLTAIKSHLLRHNIKEFNSINEVIAFQKNYFSSRQEIISNQKILIEEERSILSSEIMQLNKTITARKIEIEKYLRLEIDKLKQKFHELATDSTGIIKKFTNCFKKYFLKNKIRTNELNLDSKISSSIQPLVNTLAEKNNRYQYIDSHLMDAVYESSFGLKWTPLQGQFSAEFKLEKPAFHAAARRCPDSDCSLPDCFFSLNLSGMTAPPPIPA